MVTALSSGGARGVSLLTMVISVPLTVNYLGPERFALWATISSTLGLLVFADLGIGNGLLSAISRCDGAEDQEAAISYVSTGFFVLLAVAVVIAGVFSALYPFVPWQRILNLSSPLAIREAGPAAAVLIFCFLAQLPLGVGQRVQHGYQAGFINYSWDAAGNLLGFVGLLSVVHFRAGLVYLVLAVAGAPVLTGILNNATVFAFQRPWLRPRSDRISRAAASKILHLGFLFIVIQMSAAMGYQTDNLIIAQVLGAAKVTEYAVPLKLFAIGPSILSMLIAPLWPAYSEALARGDVQWVRETLGRSMLVVLAVSVPANLVLVIMGPQILRLWVGPQVVAPALLLVGLGSWALLNSLCGTLAMFLNGVGFVRMQAICSALMAVSNVTLSIYLTHRIGISGVIYGTIVSQIIFVLIPYSFYLPKLLGPSLFPYNAEANAR
jgi:O-antigen/teichoic acid export membrane protein